MDAQITLVTLIVKNQAEALEFYTKKLGFEKKTDFPYPNGTRWLTVRPRGQTVELALWQVGWPDATGLSRNWKAGQGPPIVLSVDNCQKAYEELRSRGVGFKQEAREVPYGTIAFFTDPDGNLFEILESKSSQR
ncbi:MAG: VOC family protein [Nitrososphaerota archaeon]|nr:VOC family protein [Nitrososphaerota archaeon]